MPAAGSSSSTRSGSVESTTPISTHWRCPCAAGRRCGSDGREANPLDHVVNGRAGARAALEAGRCKPEVLAYGQAVEDAWDLCLDADAAPRDFMRLGARDVLAAKQHRARRRLKLTRQHLEERALAGAVWADQAAQLALFESKVDVPHGLHAAEAHSEPVGLNQRGAHRAAPARGRARAAPSWPIAGASPFGTNRTKAMRMRQE